MKSKESIFNLNKEAKKKEIIEACLRIVDKYGIRGLTVKKISIEVGFVESALYRHFASKKDIIVRILKEVSNTFESIINKVEKTEIDPPKKLTMILERQCEVLQSFPGLIRLIYSDEIYIREAFLLDKLNTFLNRLIEKIEKIIKQGIREKIFRSEIDPYITAVNFLGIVQMSFSYWSIKKRKASIHFISKNLLYNFFTGIMAKI
jgi:AcrR family transcriptional regulator